MKHGLLVSMAVGDAYGAGFEFRPLHFVNKYNDLSRYFPHQLSSGKPDDHQPGMYTDDTQMSIVLAEFLLSEQPRTTLNLADAFVDGFKRDPRKGYSKKFYDLLMEIENGTDLLRNVRPHSDKCGGAMRAPVLGLLRDNRQIIDYASWQASLTHATEAGMAAAAASALLVRFCRQGISRRRIDRKIDMDIGGWGFSLEGTVLPVSTNGTEVVHAAIRAIAACDSMSDLLQQCISYSGDVDSVAAIAMAAASQHPDIEQDIPDHLIGGLENGPYGYEYLAELDLKLEEKFPRQAPEDEAEKLLLELSRVYPEF